MSSKQKRVFKRLALIVPAFVLLAATSDSRTAGTRVTEHKPEAVSNSPTSKATERGVDRPPLAGQDQNVDAADGKVALLTIRPTGFDPKELTLPQGKYLLVIRNRTGLDEITYRLERDNNQRIHEGRAARLSRDQKHFLRLSPGSYVLQETNHPDWTCRITVTAN